MALLLGLGVGSVFGIAIAVTICAVRRSRSSRVEVKAS